MKEKKMPMRKCVGCGEMKNKKDLVRIIRESNGRIMLDRTGKMNGRGAYICNNKTCLEAAIRNRGLERSFKQKVSADIYDILVKEMNQFEEP